MSFCDSSALVKLYADEPGAADVRSLSSIVVSALARVEVTAAIWRKHRAGLLSSDAAGDLAQAIDVDWLRSRYVIVQVTDDVLADAARLVTRHPLRTLDAIQLASALAARAADPSVTDFVCFDMALGAVARLEGLTVVS